MAWVFFSSEEFKNVIVKYNDLSIPNLNKVFWKYLKVIVKDNTCLKNLVNIANTCINLGY